MMKKKYFPFLVLIAAALLLFYIKKNQRGSFSTTYPTENTAPAGRGGQYLNRQATKITYTKHALCRMECRHINETEISEILQKGKINEDKIETDSRGITYPLEGITHDGQFVRVVFAAKDSDLLVVTVIDLNNEWPCDCK